MAVQCKARKTFYSDAYGRIDAGATFMSEEKYAEDLVRLGEVEILPQQPTPGNRQAFSAAPNIAGKAPLVLDASAVPPVVGQGPRSSSSPAAPPSPKPTSTTSGTKPKPSS